MINDLGLQKEKRNNKIRIEKQINIRNECPGRA